MAEAQRLVQARNVLVQEAIGAKALLSGSAWAIQKVAGVAAAELVCGAQSGQSRVGSDLSLFPAEETEAEGSQVPQNKEVSEVRPTWGCWDVGPETQDFSPQGAP